MSDAPADPGRPRSRGLVGALLFLAIVLAPGTAFAHGTQRVADSDYRARITSQDTLDGVRVSLVEAGSRFQLRNDSGRSVEVLGYSGEPYAEVRPSGVYINTYSPAAYLNSPTDATTMPSVPATASVTAPPVWAKASGQHEFRWFDHRAHWMNAAPPPGVAADPDRDQRVGTWTIELRTGTTIHTVRGTLEWVAPPRLSTWLATALLLAGAVAALAVPTVERQGPRWALVAVTGAAGLAAMVDAVGRSLVAADLSTGWFGALVADESWGFMAGVAALGAAVYAALRRPGADLALGIAGIAVAMLAGFSHLASLSNAVTPTPWGGDLARGLVTAALGIGVGLAAGSLVRARRVARITASAD
ncbi:MAG TPA: hypothetical protein VE172_24085 [Stackebrandtia sp.]|jgi:hypothetical protein|uniref:hypothetical protein n=1 Tax=Stackebrandtia sp. TaxID=2023065 RepID=UPI002D453BC9|nr:hypothetical protein [Stackebrandtia sp.]HZE41890.1 hypothetical protein [Stackebrandtia sp.]